MNFWKRIKISLIAWPGYIVLQALHSTVRWVRNDIDANRHDGTSRIYSIWHSDVLMTASMYKSAYPKKPPRQLYILVSRHFDGQLIGAALRLIGFDIVCGSSTRGGTTGMLGMIRMIRAGGDGAIMPDGPRGPLHQVKPGIIKVASESGAKIIPVILDFERCWRLRSWDRMKVPKPFTKGVVLTGTPMEVPPGLADEDLSEWQSRLTVEMMKLTREAEGYVYC